MSEQSYSAIRSFLIIIYNNASEEIARYQAPVAFAAPFANRLFREIPEVQQRMVHEPWYELVPSQARQYARSPLPEGPTSLYGEQFDPLELEPPLVLMHPDARVRYFMVRLRDLHEELFRGSYSVDDVFLHGTHFLLHNRIEQGKLPPGGGPYYYAIVPKAEAIHRVDKDMIPQDAYQAEGVFRLPPATPDKPRIQFTRMPEDPLPIREPGSYHITKTVGKGTPQAGQVYIPENLYEDLQRNLVLSDRKEEGGYILGNVYRLPNSPEQETDSSYRWLIEVTDLIMAKSTVGSPALLLFTGDSWSEMNRRRDLEFPDRKLVSWFHTHLFPATDDFGLSGLDQDMHAWYLTRPWQVAILLNLEDDTDDRTVRCYQRGPENVLVETPFYVFRPSESS